METQKLEDTYHECIKQKFDDPKVHSPLWRLVKELYNSFMEFANPSPIPEPEPEEEDACPPDEWLTPDEFIEKFPVMGMSSLHTFIRHAPNEVRQAMSHRNKQLDCTMVHSRLFLKYIWENRKSFSRMHARLERANYFGFKFNEEDEDGQED